MQAFGNRFELITNNIEKPIQYPCHCCSEQSLLYKNLYNNAMRLGVIHKLRLQEEEGR